LVVVTEFTENQKTGQAFMPKVSMGLGQFPVLVLLVRTTISLG
jgi:hypothetical protein